MLHAPLGQLFAVIVTSIASSMTGALVWQALRIVNYHWPQEASFVRRIDQNNRHGTPFQSMAYDCFRELHGWCGGFRSKSASTVNRNDSSGITQYHQSRSGWFATIIKVQSEWRLAQQESRDVQRCRKMTCYNRPDIGNRIYLDEYHNSAFASGLPVSLLLEGAT